jgi:hypothetical protein
VGIQGAQWQQLCPPQLTSLGAAEPMEGDTLSADLVHLREWWAEEQTSLCCDLGGMYHLESL